MYWYVVSSGREVRAVSLTITTTWWSSSFLRFRWCQAAKLWHLIGIRSPVLIVHPDSRRFGLIWIQRGYLSRFLTFIIRQLSVVDNLTSSRRLFCPILRAREIWSSSSGPLGIVCLLTSHDQCCMTTICKFVLRSKGLVAFLWTSRLSEGSTGQVVQLGTSEIICNLSKSGWASDQFQQRPSFSFAAGRVTFQFLDLWLGCSCASTRFRVGQDSLSVWKWFNSKVSSQFAFA